MNAIERSALDALKGCKYAPATSEKRFVRQLTPESVLTDKQREWFWLIVWRYRNQHKSEQLAMYGNRYDATWTEYALGDFSAGRFAWICKNPIAFKDPIPFKGAQGFFGVPDELVKEHIGRRA